MRYLGEIYSSDIRINFGKNKTSLWVIITSLGLKLFFHFSKYAEHAKFSPALLGLSENNSQSCF